MKIIHLSDLHFHIGHDDNTLATDMLEFIHKHYPKHYLIITGDIVDDGHERQYKNAFNALRRFEKRVFICPGNHDFGAIGSFYSKERAERFNEFLSIPLKQGGTFNKDNTPIVNIIKQEDEKVMLIGLNTNIESKDPFEFACGQVGERQLASLQTVLTSPHNLKIPKILFLHHHPFVHSNPYIELKDARELIRTIYYRVDVVLFGHKHVGNVWTNCLGIPYILAAEKSPGKPTAKEITIENGKITIGDIPIM